MIDLYSFTILTLIICISTGKVQFKHAQVSGTCPELNKGPGAKHQHLSQFCSHLSMGEVCPPDLGRGIVQGADLGFYFFGVANPKSRIVIQSNLIKEND